ncbi:G-protein beta WD-40 repeats containing protein [Reticulomyxa filosa]|uniref:G-protein beta WD-40 repeats containing protein n=1 Tax=Reticulomyxa filosa TaxID=46433 RepID=X6P1G7_RETFI|nr:G-protein beta WD-40 repeats containing protein [Reticulomyxa filosa]|eukprot:ETO31988.1 G-protein beta WD-40 repeats containing protein [Reticulomyxa filosa]
MFDSFCSSFKLLKTFHRHTNWINSIDFSTIDSSQFLYSGSDDKTVRIWDIETNKQIQSLIHPGDVYGVKFSPYHYHNHRRNVICSSSIDKKVYFWDVEDNQKLQIFKGHTECVTGIEFSPFNGGRYLCSVSGDKTIRLWDVETSKSLHVFNGHEDGIWCVDISPLQSNNNNKDDNKSNSIGVVGGNGYTICSGSFDKIIRIWDIETTKQSIVLEGHGGTVRSVKYGLNESGMCCGSNTILSGSMDYSVRLWDIRSCQEIQVFNGHIDSVWAVEYSPFVVNNIEVNGMSNVICSGSSDKTIRFWDIRSNKKELYVIKESDEGDGIYCLKFLQLKKKNRRKYNGYGINLCYGSRSHIRIWG